MDRLLARVEGWNPARLVAVTSALAVGAVVAAFAVAVAAGGWALGAGVAAVAVAVLAAGGLLYAWRLG
jgi:hypothetical protein